MKNSNLCIKTFIATKNTVYYFRCCNAEMMMMMIFLDQWYKKRAELEEKEWLVLILQH